MGASFVSAADLFLAHSDSYGAMKRAARAALSGAGAMELTRRPDPADWALALFHLVRVEGIKARTEELAKEGHCFKVSFVNLRKSYYTGCMVHKKDRIDNIRSEPQFCTSVMF